MRSLLFALVVCTFVSTASAAPLGFIDEGVTTYPSSMYAVMTQNPKPGMNGKLMLLLAKKEGLLSVLEDPDNSPTFTNVLDIREGYMCTNGPRGIHSFVAHPNFITNPFVYVYYTRIISGCPSDLITGPSNRLSRFTMNVNTLQIDAASELILLETPPSASLLHDGGGLIVGNDNKIYLATGDGGHTPHSQNLRNCWGKILRLELDGSVPIDNPYTSNGVPCRRNRGVPLSTAPIDKVCEEVYAYGLRSLFRMNVDTRVTNEVRFSLCDVGGQEWEEVSWGGTQYKGANYGWSKSEGPCARGSLSNCPVPSGNEVDPYYSYIHNRSIGAAITGAVHVPDNLWPSQYKLLLSDYNEYGIYNLIEDQSRSCRTCQPPIPPYRNETFHQAPKLVHLFFAPYKNTKALYYLSRENVAMNIRRIYYCKYQQCTKGSYF